MDGLRATEVPRLLDEVLGVASAVFERPVAASDDFFELGGDSVLAIQLLADLEQRFGTELHVSMLFDAESFGDLATKLGDHVAPDSTSRGEQ